MAQSRQTKQPLEAAQSQSDDAADLGGPVEPKSFLKPQLTYRQVQCLYWVFHGKSANDIGGIHGISGRVVEEHLQKACVYFGVKSRHQAAWRAHELGLFKDFTP